jgi:hypothetical protein
MIEETNLLLTADHSNIITPTAIKREVDISSQPKFTPSPLTTDLKQPKSYVERNSLSVESITVLDEVIDAVTPMKLPRTIVTCSTPEADTKALPRNSKHIFPLTIIGDQESNKKKI